MNSTEQVFASGLAKTMERYRRLNEGQRLDALPMADALCDDLERPIDILPALESMVRNIVWTRAQKDERERVSRMVKP